MKKGQILELVGLVLLAGLFYFGIQAAGAQTVTTAPSSHTTCKAALDYPNSNGYTESYTRPNTCHQKRVFYNYGSYFAMGNCGAGPWCAWRVRCPAGSSIQTHNSGGGWHYGMSPNIDGMYDGPSHNFCVDSAGNQVDPLPGESESSPYHTHTKNMTGYESFARAYVVDTNTSYLYSFKDYKWYDCGTAGVTGPHGQDSYRDIQYGSFPAHFHCRNATQNLIDSDSNNDNSEAPGVLLATQPSTDLVGSSFGTQDDTTTPKDQFVDKTTNWGQNPLGTVRCAHSQSDKVYFSTTGICPTANQFPPKLTYSFELTKLAGAGTVEAKTGATASVKFKLKNTSTVQIDFPVYCDSGNGALMGNMYYLNADGTTGSQFVNPGAYSGATSIPSGNAIIPAGTEKSFEFKFNIPAGSGVVGSWTAKCHTYPKDNATGNSLTEKKQEIVDQFTITASASMADTYVTTAQASQNATTKVYSLTIRDDDGIREFSVKKAGGTATVWGGTPGYPGGYGPCGTATMLKTVTESTLPVSATDFPLSATVIDCRNAGSYTFPISAPSVSTVPGAGAPEPPNNDPGVWAQVDIATSQIINSAICTKSACGINGEYHGYVPPPTYPTGSVWWPTSKRYIWQLQGQAGYASGTFDFTTYIFTVPGGTIYNGKFTPTTSPPPGTTTPGAPNAPSGLVATTASNGADVNLTWTDNSVNETGFRVHRRIIGSVDWTIDGTTGAGQTTYTDMYIPAGSYDYKITAILASGTSTLESAPSNVYSATTRGGGTGTTTPPMEDHTGCDMTMYYMRDGKYVNERGTAGPSTESLTGTGKFYKWSTDHYHLCSASGTGTTTPPPPPPQDDHTGCDMTMYYMRDGKYVNERGTAGPSTESLTGTGKFYKSFGDHSHLCSSYVMPPGTTTPPICLQVITRAYNPNTKECQDFSNSCIPTGWIAQQCELTGPVEPPIEPECRADQPSYGMCEMPEYRWRIAEKKWEKCDRRSGNSFNSSMPYRGDVMNNPKATYTNCQSMYFDIEGKWRTLRYQVRPPEKYGEWYMPAWDAAADVKQYNPKTDRFEACPREPYPNPGLLPMIAPGWELEWRGLCSPVPKEDAEWLLEMNRAQYKLWQLRKKVSQPDEPPIPPEPPQPPPEDLPPALCKGYLRGLRNSLNGDKQFFKDVKRQSAELPSDHPDVLKISSLLDEGKKIIVDMETFLQAGKCEKEKLLQNQTSKDKLHTEIFAELSSYLSAIHDYVEVGFCRTNLEEKVKRLGELAKKADDESRADLKEFAAEIKAKLAEFKEKAGDFEYDAAFECREYVREVESEFSTLVRENDRDVRRVVEDILEKELGPVLEQLRQESEARKERIDQLLVQVAELRKAADQVSGAVTDIKKSAEELSQKVAVSLKALAYIEEKFEEQKLQIEDAKGKLVPLVQRAIEILGKNRCLRGAPQASMMAEFNTMTSVNWIGNRDEELEKRLNSFITACEAREVASGDVETFVRAVDEASEQNQLASHEKGLTPFADVPTHEWYYGGMVTGHRTGFITQGRPGDNVLRQDALLMVLRAAGATDADLIGSCTIPGRDVRAISDYAKCGLLYAAKKISIALSGNFQEPIERREVALWIAALFDFPAPAGDTLGNIRERYTDIYRAGLSTEEVTAIEKLIGSGVMVGVVTEDSAVWQPDESLTRAALAVVLEQLLKVR